MGSKQEYVAKEDLAPGQKVLYHPVGGSTQVTEGVIKEIITEPEVRTVRVDLVKIDCIDFNYFFGLINSMLEALRCEYKQVRKSHEF